jgi:adenine-specific DNA methylase
LSSSPKRLIEVAFPLKQTSLDSVHEKNVRHGHISTLHIWPARRPLAACRAALITTLLPDPGDPVERKQILEKLGGRVVQKVKRKKTDAGWAEEVTEETEGGILHWGRESGQDLDWFRAKIREAYGGRAPKVLDPFAGGGAIPLEAMRLGCEATAVDINPVAWFILKCTLEYPQKLAGQKLPLPNFAVQDPVFMEQYLKVQGFKGKALAVELEKFGGGKADNPQLPGFETSGVSLEADLAWHVRAWGHWVLKEARKELAPYYPTYADFEPLVEVTGKVEKRPMTLVPLTAEGEPDIDALNAEFSPEYLADRRNPRWVAKPTVAYLWARTVICKNCRATIPLLKTRWLCKKDKKRVVLTMHPNADKTGVVFGVQQDVPVLGKSVAEKKAHDAIIGGGTMSRSGTKCPCCETILTNEDIRLESKTGNIKSVLTSVVSEGREGKSYRLPTNDEKQLIENIQPTVEHLFKSMPFGIPDEETPGPAGAKFNSSSLRVYGLNEWKSLFTPRQLLSLGVIAKVIRQSKAVLSQFYYSSNWIEAINSYLSITFDKCTDYNSTICTWHNSGEKIGHTFARFALPFTWDFAELAIINETGGAFTAQLQWVALFIEHSTKAAENACEVQVSQKSSVTLQGDLYDLVLTDPPYYDAISYSDIMDFFYIWIRRVYSDINESTKKIFSDPLSPKWDHEKNDGELIDNPVRFDGDKEKSKQVYEDGMYSVFRNCCQSLTANGRMVIVFANKNPDAWETLVSAIIRAGFVVDGSWPIQTEMGTRSRARGSAALSSSIWLVCKKRNPTARPGWDNKVLEEMRVNIITQLREFWDAGIRGPDFVWAATGPAMEAYSQYPVVKKANEPGAVMTVSEFLTHVRRMVVDFVVGRVLTGDGEEEVTGLDNITTYYLLHRHDFGMNDASAGPCILYAVSCGLSDKDLADRYDLLARRGGKEQEEDDETENEDSEVEEEGSGSSFRLKAWNQRKQSRMGYDPATDSSAEKLPLFPDMAREVQPSREIPLIDQVHRLMHLWKGGDVSKVNEYLDLRGLRRNPLFHQLLQALIELAPAGSEERSLLESISNHVGGQKSQSPKLFVV